eukprot:CAMPEP_0173415582 /NCGR_PEP_ID=MMETSP1356-20130122/84932_1 /TAXON_ID=77927 ORGANISM="Hemiselmis virescens, Strain PCC157" /NCGR_SAMPLE_ID=MMETSP1356 /ASSEMBLY_ACC=CAM_ASM_000847 /LENGTH=206 /DNA_ID=CAMNT_0014377835 /DNA_START=2073 /DNA_END=2689 /DNA_ORIENTATION=+
MSDFDSIFGAKTLKESFNREAALYLQEHISEYVSDPIKQASSQDTIDRLITQSRGESFIHVVYNKAAVSAGKHKRGVKDHGRWFASPGAMQGMCKLIRQTICDGLWIDIDFVNCHPAILAGVCKTLLRIPHKFLEKYIKDRDPMLLEMVEGSKKNTAPVKPVDSESEEKGEEEVDDVESAESAESEVPLLSRDEAKKRVLKALNGG